jgi:hypothetical protein
MDSTDPRERDQGFTEPDGLAHDPGTPRWNTLGGEDGSRPVAVPDDVSADDAGEVETPNPGPRRAAFGVILCVVAIVVGALAQLAGFAIVVWLAVAAFVVAVVMVAQGYLQWRADAEG